MIRTDTIQITPEILALVAEIDEFKGALARFGIVGARPFAGIASYRDYREHRLFDAHRRQSAFGWRSRAVVDGFGDSNSRVARRAGSRGLLPAMEMIFDVWDEMTITENHIEGLHQQLLSYSEKDEWHRGNYKKFPNSVAAFDETGRQIGIVFETATPFETPRRMEELVSWLNRAREEKRLHPLFSIAVFAVVFLEIHPFQDGNGRLSRVLTTLLLLQTGYAYVPYSSLESVIENSKEGYYLALRQTQGTIRSDAPNWRTWIEFFCARCKGKSDDWPPKSSEKSWFWRRCPNCRRAFSK